MRNKDERVCVPFPMSKEKTSIPLPPLHVAKFKWYQCQACLEADGAAVVPNINTSTNAEGNGIHLIGVSGGAFQHSFSSFSCLFSTHKDGVAKDRNLEVVTCPRSHSIVSNDQLMIQANHEDGQGNQIHPSNTQKFN